MQAVEKLNKLVEDKCMKEQSNYSEPNNDRFYSVNHSSSMSADELIDSIRDRIQNILMDNKRYMEACKSMSMNKRNTKNDHVLYITMNKKSV